MIDRDSMRQIEQQRVIERPPLYLPWAQRFLNSFPLASSGGTWGEMGQPWAVNVLTFSCSVFVATTNNATNFWTLELLDSAGVLIATLNTAAIAANTWTRLTTSTIAQPGASNPRVVLRPTATLSPGAIFIAPAVALLRTGN